MSSEKLAKIALSARLQRNMVLHSIEIACLRLEST